MASAYRIRLAVPADFNAIVAIVRVAVEAGDALPWEDGVTDEELSDYWLPNPAVQLETFVAEGDDGVAGVCLLHPAARGRGSHGAHGAFVVAPAARGRGLGKRLCTCIIEEAARRGYTSMRFDQVVSTNAAAVRVCTACGFKVMCTLPRVFQHRARGLVDAHVMFRDFESKESKEAALPTGNVFEKVVTPTAFSALPTAPVSAADVVAAGGGSQLSAAAAVELCYRRASGTRGAGAAEGVCDAVATSVGEEVRMEPSIAARRCHRAGRCSSTLTFAVKPELPAGLRLEPDTGIITGTPLQPCQPSAYQVFATLSTQIHLQVEEAGYPEPHPEPFQPPQGKAAQQCIINQDFVDQIDQVVDPADMLPEPARTRAYGDWMIWMVHRAWLDDPSLIELDFTSMDMPLGHIEKRIAPKLVAAMATNTHLEVLSLSNSNLQRAQALELAVALRENRTLMELNLESNWLDSNAVRELALAIQSNPHCRLEHFRVSHQKQMGQFFGRPTEEAVGQMMEQNETIVKLGFECDDAHWRNLIDRALLRNNDSLRRRQQTPSAKELPPAEERTLGHLLLQVPPAWHAAEMVKDSVAHSIFLRYVEQNYKLPTTAQLQTFAKNIGAPLPYNIAAPLIKECRAAMLDGAEGSEVVIIDAFGQDARGTLRSWSEVNEHWCVEVWTGDSKRFIFKSSKEPGFSVSSSWAGWLAASSDSGAAGQLPAAAAVPGRVSLSRAGA